MEGGWGIGRWLMPSFSLFFFQLHPTTHSGVVAAGAPHLLSARRPRLLRRFGVGGRAKVGGRSGVGGRFVGPIPPRKEPPGPIGDPRSLKEAGH